MSGWPPTSFLGRLSSGSRSAVLRLGTRRRLAADEILIQEHARADFVAVLLTGLYKVVGLTDDGREALLAVRVGGDLVGELGLADGEPRSATVRSAGDGEYLRIGERDYRAFLATYPDANAAMARAMAAKLRSATRRRVEFAAYPAAVRVARILCELAAAHGAPDARGVRIAIALAQPELASLVGATEPTVQRVLYAMRDAGIIAVGRRTVWVLDQQRLDESARR